MPILAKVYFFHIIVSVMFIVYTYTFLPLCQFERIRRTISMDKFFAFIIITSWRCMPPQLLPPEFGFVDVLRNGPQSAWTQNQFQFTIAAMPSLHLALRRILGFAYGDSPPILDSVD
ncbi:hypothetical protein V2W45_1339324 [Cenococcum geophilum]